MLICPTHSTIDDNHYQVSLGQFDFGPVHPFFFDLVIGIAKPSCVRQVHGPTINVSGTFYPIARRTSLRMYQGQALTRQGVHETALAHIRRTSQHHRPRLCQMDTQVTPLQQLIYVLRRCRPIFAIQLKLQVSKGSPERSLVLI
jgi:hypothetical protein